MVVAYVEMHTGDNHDTDSAFGQAKKKTDLGGDLRNAYQNCIVLVLASGPARSDRDGGRRVCFATIQMSFHRHSWMGAVVTNKVISYIDD
jgi:hypothetical protein